MGEISASGRAGLAATQSNQAPKPKTATSPTRTHGAAPGGIEHRLRPPRTTSRRAPSKSSARRQAANELPLRSRDAKGSVLTANMIEYVGSEKAADWDDDLTGPPGKFIDT